MTGEDNYSVLRAHVYEVRLSARERDSETVIDGERWLVYSRLTLCWQGQARALRSVALFVVIALSHSLSLSVDR